MSEHVCLCLTRTSGISAAGVYYTQLDINRIYISARWRIHDGTPRETAPRYVFVSQGAHADTLLRFSVCGVGMGIYQTHSACREGAD